MQNLQSLPLSDNICESKGTSSPDGDSRTDTCLLCTLDQSRAPARNRRSHFCNVIEISMTHSTRRCARGGTRLPYHPAISGNIKEMGAACVYFRLLHVGATRITTHEFGDHRHRPVLFYLGTREYLLVRGFCVELALDLRTTGFLSTSRTENALVLAVKKRNKRKRTVDFAAERPNICYLKFRRIRY